MYVKTLLLAVAMIFSTTSHAQSQSNVQEVLKYMKEKFSVSYHGEYYFQRGDAASNDESVRQLQDFRIKHIPTVIYKPVKNWQLASTTEFNYSDQDNETVYPNTFYRGLFTLTKKNILEEKTHGIQLDLGIGRRQFNMGLPVPNYGNNRIFTTLTKNFAKVNSAVLLQYLHNDIRRSGPTQWKHGVEIYPTINIQITDKLSWLITDDININTPKYDNTERDYSITHEANLAYVNYQWTDKIGTYYQFKYNHIENFTNRYRSKFDNFDNYLGVSYAFLPKATIIAEIGSEIFSAHDGRDGFSKKLRYPEYYMYLDFAL